VSTTWRATSANHLLGFAKHGRPVGHDVQRVIPQTRALRECFPGQFELPLRYAEASCWRWCTQLRCEAEAKRQGRNNGYFLRAACHPCLVVFHVCCCDTGAGALTAAHRRGGARTQPRGTYTTHAHSRRAAVMALHKPPRRDEDRAFCTGATKINCRTSWPPPRSRRARRRGQRQQQPRAWARSCSSSRFAPGSLSASLQVGHPKTRSPESHPAATSLRRSAVLRKLAHP
jgi:hypothetical protein